MKPNRAQMRIGIDLGGTKTEVIVLSATGDVLLRDRVPTPSHDYYAILDTIQSLVARAQVITGPVPQIGVGMPGAADQHTGLIKNANTTCLIGQPLEKDLTLKLGCPVVLENDANCFVLSEAVDGAAANDNTVFGVILGTGVGGGLAFNQTLWTGLHHIAGEWGHNPIPLRFTPASPSGSATLNSAPWVGLGRPCYCGRTDCVETHLCGRGLVQTWTHLSQHPAPEELSVPWIVNQAKQGDPTSSQTLDLYAQQLACALSTIINLLDPDAIVLGGGLSQLPDLASNVQKWLPQFVFNTRVDTSILIAAHGDSSGVRGAAWL